MEIVSKFVCEEEFQKWGEYLSAVNEELEYVEKYLCTLQGHLSEQWEGEASEGAQAFTRLIVRYLNTIRQPSMLMEERIRRFDKGMDTFEDESQTKINLEHIVI